MKEKNTKAEDLLKEYLIQQPQNNSQISLILAQIYLSKGDIPNVIKVLETLKDKEETKFKAWYCCLFSKALFSNSKCKKCCKVT